MAVGRQLGIAEVRCEKVSARSPGWVQLGLGFKGTTPEKPGSRLNTAKTPHYIKKSFQKLYGHNSDLTVKIIVKHKNLWSINFSELAVVLESKSSFSKNLVLFTNRITILTCKGFLRQGISRWTYYVFSS